MPATIRKPRRNSTRPRKHIAQRPLSATPALETRRVLIATDGSQAASAALRIARLMTDRGQWAPEVLTVCEPLPLSVGEITLPAPVTQHEVALTDSMITAIKRQMRRHGAAGWQLAVKFGRAAPLIANAARDGKMQLIILGLGRHRAIARLFGAETAARIIRRTDVPVLAVHPKARTLPKVAIAAMDFGDSSVRAAREALALLEPPARLHLVHVKWGYNVSSLRDSDWERAYNAGVEHGFARLKAEIAAPAGIDITSEFLHGGVIKSLLDNAKAIGADLLALGSHSQTVIDRLLIGSTPVEVLREAQSSVLVAPPADART